MGCTARFVPSTALDETDSLEGVDLVLLTLTPELSVHRRETLTKKLQDVTKLHRTPIIRLVAASEIQEEASQKTRYTVSWPCSTEELLQSIGEIQSRSCKKK
jgi:hypothetical protein